MPIRSNDSNTTSAVNGISRLPSVLYNDTYVERSIPTSPNVAYACPTTPNVAYAATTRDQRELQCTTDEDSGGYVVNQLVYNEDETAPDQDAYDYITLQ